VTSTRQSYRKRILYVLLCLLSIVSLNCLIAQDLTAKTHQTPLKIAGIEIPPSVTENVAKSFKLAPSLWGVAARRVRNNDIVALCDGNARYVTTFTYLVNNDRWIRLNDSSGVTYISHLLDASTGDFEVPDKLNDFMHDLSILYRGYPGIALTNQFRLESDKPFSSRGNQIGFLFWVSKPGDVELLRSLCGESIKKGNDEFGIRINVLTYTGGIDQWTVKGNMQKNLEIKTISSRHIYPDNTFVYCVSGE